MKKIVVLLVVALAVWVGINYMRTGTLSLFPASSSPQAQRLHDLEQELAAVESQIDQAGRMAGMTGADTTSDVAALTVKKEQLEKQIAAAKSAPR